MRVVRAILDRRIGKGHLDSLLSRWGLCGGGFVVFAVAVKTLRGVARNRAEFAFGVGAALVSSLAMALLGVLAGRFHDAAARGDLGTRSGALLSYPACLAILVLGGWQTSVLGVGEAGMIIGLLLLLAACMATLSLGVLADLVRSFPRR